MDASTASVSLSRSHIRAGLMMVLANLLFIINDTGVKLVTDTMNIGSIIVMRNAIAAVALVGIMGWTGELRHVSGMFGKIAVFRTLIDALLTILFFTALAHMPIANLTAIVQSLPIVVATAAVFTLKEKLGLARILIIVGGFVGVLFIVQPGSDAFSQYSILGLLVVACAAARDILTRRIGLHVPGSVVALGNMIGVALVGWALAVWSGGVDWPNGWDWAILLMSGLCVGGGLVALVKTLRMASIGVTAPFRYSVVLWSILSGILVFGDVPNGLALIGIGLIIATGIAAIRQGAA
jgi:drug/metabolite transporter (DMT)-like permease